MYVNIRICSFKRQLLFSTLYLYIIYCSLCEAQCPVECLCHWKGRVNCDKVGLQEIPSESDLPALANKLMLSFNFINVINDEYLQNMQDMLEIHLEGNTIQEIPSNTFTACSNLVVLNLRGNRIATLLNEAFVGLNKLKVLNLSENNIYDIHQLAFKPLTLLQTLDLYDNSLRQLNDGMFRHLRSLRKLDLGKSKLISISSPNVFRGLGNLTWLGLGDNTKVSTLPRGMCLELSALKTLTLEGCDLQSLTADMFYGCKTLEQLYLQKTGLRNTLPLQMFNNIPNLVELRIDRNHLMSLHESILSSMKRLDKVFLQNNNWQCSCGLMNMRARWRTSKPSFLQEGLTCKGPSTINPLRDLWNIPLKDLQAQCVSELNDVKPLHLPTDFSDELYLDCPISQTGLSVLDWITAGGHYITKNTINDKYRVFDNGTLHVSKAQSGTYMCSVTVPSGESSRAGFKVIFSDSLFGSPVSPNDPEDSDHSNSDKTTFMLPVVLIVAVVLIIAFTVAWLRCRRAKRADEKPFDSPFPVAVKNMDSAYAYASISVPEGKAKKKRDISAYAINALFEIQLPEVDKTNGYDQIKGQRPKSHSCRERGSKYSAPVPIPRPSHTIGSRGTSRAESCVYVTPANNGGMGMFMSTNMLSDPDMNIPLYGATKTAEEDIQDKGLKRLRELQSKSVSGAIRPKSNPYMELIA